MMIPWTALALMLLCALMLGLLLGMMVTRTWMLRFRYEAQHWNKVVDDWRQAYNLAHDHSKALRNELVEVNRKITALTVRECEVLEWVNRSVKRAKEESEKSAKPSTAASAVELKLPFEQNET